MPAFQELDQQTQEALCNCTGFQHAAREARFNLVQEVLPDGRIIWVSKCVKQCSHGCEVRVTIEQGDKMPAPVRRGSEQIYEQINVYDHELADCLEPIEP